MDKNKISWIDRLRVCWFVLKKGTVDGMPECKTQFQKEQWEICKKRQAEMDACVRPRTTPKVRGHCTYTDYYEGN